MAVTAGFCIAAALAGESGREWLRFDRQGLEQLQLWRLFSAHFVHLGWSHLALNVAALAVTVALFDGWLRVPDFVFAGAVAGLCMGACLYLLEPRVEWYVGLSGMLHGLVSFGGLSMARTNRVMGLAIVAAVIGKVGYEQWLGPVPFTAGSVAGPVLLEAHLYGGAGGFVAACLHPLLPGARDAPV